MAIMPLAASITTCTTTTTTGLMIIKWLGTLFLRFLRVPSGMCSVLALAFSYAFIPVLP